MTYDEFYSDLPFHNKEHAIAVEQRALSIAEKLKSFGTEVNLNIISEAAKLHDACFGDQRAKSYNVALRHIEALNEEEINRIGSVKIEVVESYSPSLGYKNHKSAKKGIQNKLGKYNLSKD